MSIDYNNRKFTGVSNSVHGQVSNETVFQYYQQANILTGTYSGGKIQSGHLIGLVYDDSSLEFVYHHLDTDGKLMSGFCRSIPRMSDDGRIHLYEKWHWTFGGEGSGESIVEEISDQHESRDDG